MKSKYRRRRLLTESLEIRHLLAGPYAPAAGQIGSDAIAIDDPAIVGWAMAIANYTPGSDVDLEFQTPEKALGKAIGDSFDVVSLGRAGQLTLAFAVPIRDGLGADFAIFENAITDSFLELGFVEVSSDGVNFFRFQNDSLSPAIGPVGEVDPTDVNNLAGKYRQGFGTPFDLEELATVDPRLDVSSISHVRLIDIVGDGATLDSSGDPIYDPTPTTGSAGLDVDAVAVLHQNTTSRFVVDFEDTNLAANSVNNGPVAGGTSTMGPFGDTVIVGDLQSEMLSLGNAYSVDFDSWTGFAFSNHRDVSTPGFGNQFSSFAGGGATDSATYAVGFPDQSGSFGPASISLQADDDRQFESLQITNTTYAALSMALGDSFAKKFGGVSGDDPDFLLLKIEGKDSSDDSIGVIEFYLADYRFADNSLDYIVNEWTTIDLGPIAGARELEFSLESLDAGPFGINTPTYFALDDIRLVRPALAVDFRSPSVDEAAGEQANLVRITRPNSDATTAVEVELAIDHPIVTAPTSVTIEAGQRYVEFPIGVIDNDAFDGNQAVTITATADGFADTTIVMTVLDDETPRLSLSLESNELLEGDSLVATVTRDTSDLSEPLVVEIGATDDSLIESATMVTIAVNDSMATFTIGAIDDNIDRPDFANSIHVSATGFLGGSANLDVIDNDSATILIELPTSTFSESQAAPSVSFEALGRGLAPESFDNGADNTAGFVSDGLSFNNEYNADFASWQGWSLSNVTDTTTAGFANQYSAIVGSGVRDSDTYLIGTAFEGFTTTISRDPTSSNPFQSIAVTNSTYAALSMTDGDAFAKKFGGESGDDPDFFLLTISGFDQSGQAAGSVDFYLADFRFDDNALDYIVDQWANVDLSSLTDATELRFALSSSDVGMFGMNTPAYFAVDNIVLERDDPAPFVTIRRNTLDVSEAVEVSLFSGDSSEVSLPNSVTIPANVDSVEVPLAILGDDLVDGDQSITLSASANQFETSLAFVRVTDIDQPTTTLTIKTVEVSENEGIVVGVLHRNDANPFAPLTVSITADASGELDLPNSITLAAGARSVEFSLMAIDNDVVDEDRTIRLTASATGYASSEGSVTLINDDVAPPMLTLELDRGSISESEAPPSIGFEDLGSALPMESFDNGSAGEGGFQSGNLFLNNNYDPTFGSWSGWSISNMTDNTTAGFSNQYSGIVGEGAGKSATYAVASVFAGGTLPTLELADSTIEQKFSSISITNTTYAALSMADGDSFAKKFGGESGDDPDYFLLTIEGRDETGDSVGNVEFYLADFSFEDNSLDYIVDQWIDVDVSSLGEAKSLEFSLSSSDVGDFGINTPAYFAIDNVLLSHEETSSITATVTRDDEQTDEPLLVMIENGDESEVRVPHSVTIPAGDSSATFSITSLDDAVVDGDVEVAVSVTADSHQGATTTLAVTDNDTARLTLSAQGSSIGEVAGESAFELLIHRNDENATESLTVDLSSVSAQIQLPPTATIPAGSPSVLVAVGIEDNNRLDGDRTVTFESTADGWVDGIANILVLDDEVPGFVVTQSENQTAVTELIESDSITVALLAEPLSDVVVDLSSTDQQLDFDIPRLTFTPEDWDQPQTVNVRAVADFIEEETAIIPLNFLVDSDASHALFTSDANSELSVIVRDYQPVNLVVTENDTLTIVRDEDSQQVFSTGNVADGVQIVANDLPQKFTIEELTRTVGSVDLDLAGGDDTVILRGNRFTSLEGGEGDDQLVLELSDTVNLNSLLVDRVSGFERLVLHSTPETEFDFDISEAGSIAVAGIINLETATNQNLRFIGSATLVESVMEMDQLVHVVRTGDGTEIRLHGDNPNRNPLNRLDANNDGKISTLDALAVVNDLGPEDGSDTGPEESTTGTNRVYLDVSGNGHVTALDALLVINELANQVEVIQQEFVQALPETWDLAQMIFNERESVLVEPFNDKPVRKLVVVSSAHDQAIAEMYR